MKTLLIQCESDNDLKFISEIARQKGAVNYIIDNSVLQEYIENIGLANAMKEVDDEINDSVDFDTFMQELSNAGHN